MPRLCNSPKVWLLKQSPFGMAEEAGSKGLKEGTEVTAKVEGTGKHRKTP